jgi:dTDP-4-amino-4,6-dideoxygalactose transaminase
MNDSNTEIPLMDVSDENLVLFHPHVPKSAASRVSDVLSTRWIGQGPLVDKFEGDFSNAFCNGNPALAVGSGTDALHLAYLLAGIKEGDEVVVPVFTCTATNIPLLYIGAKIKFVDVDPKTLNIDVEHLKNVVTEATKAIVVVHYAGFPCDMDEIREIATKFGIPIIEDAAHAVGATYKGVPVGAISEFTMFSFQAIKHITTGDGGLLTFKDGSIEDLGKRLRWFGIDRRSKQLGIWENDIKEIGYKYQMTDIGAAMGLAALEEFADTLTLRQRLLNEYQTVLNGIPGLEVLSRISSDRTHAAWLSTVSVENRKGFQRKLLENNIESNQVHYRNDRYSIFGSRQSDLPNMDSIEDKYVCLPLHTKMTLEDVHRVATVIKSGW